MIPTPYSQDWQAAPAGNGAILEGYDDIRQCITHILLAQKGSDPFRPDFGVNLLGLIDQPVTIVAATKADIRRQLEKYEPRIKVESLTVEVSGENVTFAVRWRLGSTVQTTIVKRG